MDGDRGDMEGRDDGLWGWLCLKHKGHYIISGLYDFGKVVRLSHYELMLDASSNNACHACPFFARGNECAEDDFATLKFPAIPNLMLRILLRDG